MNTGLLICTPGQTVEVHHGEVRSTGQVVGVWDRTNGTIVSVQIDAGAKVIDLRIGAIVRITELEQSEAQDVRGSVWRRFVAGEIAGYRFLVSDSKEEGVDERRRLARVRPLPGEKIVVEIIRPGASAPLFGEMCDISSGGMRLQVPRAAAQRLVDLESVDVRLRLSDRGEFLEVESRICHRRVAGGVIYLGLQFLPADSSTSERLNVEIDRYVGERLR